MIGFEMIIGNKFCIIIILRECIGMFKLRSFFSEVFLF